MLFLLQKYHLKIFVKHHEQMVQGQLLFNILICSSDRDKNLKRIKKLRRSGGEKVIGN